MTLRDEQIENQPQIDCGDTQFTNVGELVFEENPPDPGPDRGTVEGDFYQDTDGTFKFRHSSGLITIYTADGKMNLPLSANALNSIPDNSVSARVINPGGATGQLLRTADSGNNMEMVTVSSFMTAASGAEVNTGTDDNKFVNSAALQTSDYLSTDDKATQTDFDNDSDSTYVSCALLKANAGFPSGATTLFALSACPAGWVQETNYTGKLLKAGNPAGVNGGSNTHTHVVASHRHNFNASASQLVRGGSTPVVGWYIGQDTLQELNSADSGPTAAYTSKPPSKTLIFCRKS